ncbi:MAG TPA: hypothetical protein VIL49_05445 [Capillimicrobium sp.]|jgi:hypothetical protein
MELPQTHHTSTGRAVEVDRTGDGTLTFSDGGARLATLTPAGGGEWRLTLPDGEARTLHAAQDDPPIAAVILQIDLHESEDSDTSGADD